MIRVLPDASQHNEEQQQDDQITSQANAFTHHFDNVQWRNIRLFLRLGLFNHVGARYA